MLYKGAWNAEQMLIVETCEAESDALAQGWNRTPTPRPPGYPPNWCEVDRTRGSDYRRIIIRSPEEERTFLGVVELDGGGKPTKWVRDDEYKLGGRGIGLDGLVTERKSN
jgi:hypothetical protein